MPVATNGVASGLRNRAKKETKRPRPEFSGICLVLPLLTACAG